MKPGNLSKLLFAGVAAGIALSCAIVLTTAVSSIPQPISVTKSKTDRLASVAGSDPKSDRILPPVSKQEVVRSGKSDALEITLAILRGSDIAPSDPLPITDPLDTIKTNPVADAETVVKAPVDETVVTPVTALGTEPETPAALPVTARPVKVVTSRTEPINIIPVPAPVHNTPVSAPTTTTNFTTEPTATSTDIGIRPDLAR